MKGADVYKDIFDFSLLEFVEWLLAATGSACPLCKTWSLNRHMFHFDCIYCKRRNHQCMNCFNKYCCKERMDLYEYGIPLPHCFRIKYND